MHFIKSFGDLLLFITTPVILGASLLLTFKTRFIQFRKLPHMLRLFFSMIFKRHPEREGEKTVRAHRALFTAMSTTIGISTIVSPIIAIRLGGPGAILGFVVATLLGAAVNFTEVTFALSYRKTHPEKGIAGGPMQYLRDAIHPAVAKMYAFFGFLLLMAWSAAQANQLAELLNSPLVGKWAIPNWITGVGLALLVTFILLGGIKRVSSFSAKLVPAMFLIFVGGALWIIGMNFSKLPAVFGMILDSALHPRAFGTGAVVGGIMSAMRWGVFKGLHANEAGVGTQTIPHSMAETNSPTEQGILAMISTYAAGFICLLSGLVALLTETWIDPDLSLGINMVAAAFHHHFASIGVIAVVASSLLFAFGTILGNGYNGSQCFLFLTKHKKVNLYFIATAFLVFLGAVTNVTIVWSVIDYMLVPVVLPHILSLVYLSFKEHKLLNFSDPLIAT